MRLHVFHAPSGLGSAKMLFDALYQQKHVKEEMHLSYSLAL